jgi:glycosyltransferase involved in cell wall biosynthesis
LEELNASVMRDFEVIVVDDASTDETSEVARHMGAKVLTQKQRTGPAAARNLGAWEASAPILFFIDADVGVRPDTLSLVVAASDQDQKLDALFGSYDSDPPDPNVVSQYRNLFHHFVHQHGQENACTFWSGCGAIRREVFLAHGGFDDKKYARPCIEDIELGARLRSCGHRIALKKAIQVAHRKRWTFWNLLKTDVVDRGIPWTLLLLREKQIPNDLNLKTSQRISGVLTLILLGLFGMEAWRWNLVAWVPVLVLGGIAFVDRFFAPRFQLGGLIFLFLVPALVIAIQRPLWLGITLGISLVIVALNREFYSFFARIKPIPFLAVVLPLHLFYFFYSGLAFGIGFTIHATKHHPCGGALPGKCDLQKPASVGS